MKQIIFILIFLTGNLSSFAQKNNYSWSVGLRTGAAYELDAYLEQYNRVGGIDFNPTTSLQQQLFVNKTLGEKQQWMLEANLSYFAHTDKQGVEGSGILNGHHYTSVNHYRNLGIQINGRYALYTLRSLKWKHYLGLSLNATNTMHRYNGLDNDVIMQSSEQNSWHPFAGLEYYGQISLSARLSIQYSLNYLATSLDLDMLSGDLRIASPRPGDPRIFQRINFGFGLGWHF